MNPYFSNLSILLFLVVLSPTVEAGAEKSVSFSASTQRVAQRGDSSPPRRNREDFAQGYSDGFCRGLADGRKDHHQRRHFQIPSGLKDSAYERGFRKGYQDGFERGKSEPKPRPRTPFRRG